MDLPVSLEERLFQKKATHAHRKLVPRTGIDFSSNDYLGFSEDPSLREFIRDGLAGDFPLGSSGSRLLRGNLQIFQDLEMELAHFCGTEAALFFSSGFQCNLGVLSAILNSNDLVFSDELNHASLIDGMRLSGAHRLVYPHLDLVRLEELLRKNASHSGLKLIVTESLFSMDGDQAPLSDLVDLAKRYSALLIVDEAHATGLWGDFNKGLGGGLVQALGLREGVFATLHPAGKAMGVGGAWVCGSKALIDYLINFSRPFIFSTASPPILAHSLRMALRLWKEVGRERAEKVLEFSSLFQSSLHGKVLAPRVSGPIVPILLGDNLLALKTAERIQKHGFDVRAIRPPTVSEGKARLRVTIHSTNTREEISKLAESIGESS